MASANEGLRAEVVEHQRVKGRLLALMLDAIAKERVGARSGPDLRVFALPYCRSASSVITNFVLQMISVDFQKRYLRAFSFLKYVFTNSR